MLLSVSTSINICLICLTSPMLGTYTFTTVFICLNWSREHCPLMSSFASFYSLKSLGSDICIAAPPFFLFPFAWNIFFHPLTFSLFLWIWSESLIGNLCMGLFQKIHSATLCLLTSPFTFLSSFYNISVWSFLPLCWQ